ncbi:MAG: PDZ domain-containing protein [Chloracidobacterium sp.]|nr:PDZ domain-containing protein [Chloracidobacterium sp.]
MTPVIAKQLGLDSNDGLVVADIDPNGPAATAGISRGDVILEINKRPISSVADFKTVIDASAGKPILKLITRRGQGDLPYNKASMTVIFSLTLKLPERCSEAFFIFQTQL